MPNETTEIEAANGIGNMALYRMCAEWPLHDNARHVSDKMLFIARPYSVARNLGGHWDEMAKALVAIGPEIDGALSLLRFKRFPECKVETVELHATVDRVICSALRGKGTIKTQKPDGGSRSSFVSKYLHFHAPDAIPILDALAKHGLFSETKGFRTRISRPSDYARFCERLEYLLMIQQRNDESLRSIDKRLVEKGRALKDGKGK